MGKKRKYYWNPCADGRRFVDETAFIYGFNERHPAGLWRERHIHDGWGELMVMCSGSSTMLTEHGNFLANKHQCVWCPSGVEHEFYTIDPSHNRTLFIHDSAIATAPRFRSCQIIQLTPLLRELIFSVVDLDLDLSKPEDLLFGQALVDTLIRSPSAETILYMPRSPLLQQICHDLLASIDREVQVEEFCQQLDMSKKSFLQLFQRETGISFSRWIQLARLDFAHSSLMEGKSVTETTFACGYSSVSSFIVAFRKHFGITPGRLCKHTTVKD